jgi:hypothetical protein
MGRLPEVMAAADIEAQMSLPLAAEHTIPCMSTMEQGRHTEAEEGLRCNIQKIELEEANHRQEQERREKHLERR